MSSPTEPADWRPAVAALANPYAREVFAQIVLGHQTQQLGQGFGAARLRKVIETLTEAGLVRERDGRFEVRPEAFTSLLTSTPRERPSGPGRYLDREGMIDRYPQNRDELEALLRMVAARVLAEGEVLSEKELNGRLRTFTQDVPALRRHLVDAAILERTRSGSEYALVLDRGAVT